MYVLFLRPFVPQFTYLRGTVGRGNVFSAATMIIKVMRVIMCLNCNFRFHGNSQNKTTPINKLDLVTINKAHK